MGKILLIGGIGAGKTTLKQWLLQQDLRYHKTQMLEFSQTFIDCPGEYLEIPRYYHVLIDASHRVTEIWALQDATKARTFYPPGFAKVFTKPVIGVITKTDLAGADISRAESFLKYAGLQEPFYATSVINGDGFHALSQRVEALHEHA